jgi:hypothetical protein
MEEERMNISAFPSLYIVRSAPKSVISSLSHISQHVLAKFSSQNRHGSVTDIKQTTQPFRVLYIDEKRNVESNGRSGATRRKRKSR